MTKRARRATEGDPPPDPAAGPSPAPELRWGIAHEFPRESSSPQGAVSATAEELAKALRLTPRGIRDLAQRGVIAKLAHGTYDLWESIGRYAEHMREAAAGRGGHSAGSSLTVEKTREARERADHLALKNAEARRELVPADAVERTWADTLRGVRGRVLAVSARCQQRLPHLTAHDVAAIDRELRDALTEVGRDGDA